jgi:hypothetical protein
MLLNITLSPSLSLWVTGILIYIMAVFSNIINNLCQIKLFNLYTYIKSMTPSWYYSKTINFSGAYSFPRKQIHKGLKKVSLSFY